MKQQPTEAATHRSNDAGYLSYDVSMAIENAPPTIEESDHNIPRICLCTALKRTNSDL